MNPDFPNFFHTQNGRQTTRVVLFLLVAAAIWGGYFRWRPPRPMLHLSHLEHLGEVPQVALTFDDAPHPLTTPLLLTALKRTGVKASFFVVGDGLQLYPELSARMVEEGHRLANHSQYHINMTRLSPAEYAHEVHNCFVAMDAVYADAGISTTPTRLFRPPGGGLNRDVMNYLFQNQVTLAWWSNNVGDWTRPPAWKIARGVKANLRAGDIVLLHDAGPGTAQALASIVKEARAQGLQFVPMPEN